MKNNHSFTLLALRYLLTSFSVGLVLSFLLMAFIVLLTGKVQAQELEGALDMETQTFEHPAGVKRGSLLFYGKDSYTSAPLLHTEVHMEITGMIVRSRVRQEFRNIDDDWKEGVYVFPLPENAAVDHMRMHIGEKSIEGQIRERQQAKKIYQQAKKTGRKASLIEQERPNIFTTSVANIGPRESIIIEIEYQQIVKYDLGIFSLRFPLVVGPRYIPGNLRIEGFEGDGWARNTDLVPDAARISPPVIHPSRGKINPVNISITLDAGFKLEHIDSPYHAIETTHDSATAYRIKLKDTEIPADRDFLLEWKPVAGASPRAALFKQEYKGDEYALLMLLPPESTPKKTLNREIVFVIDTSGSMGGTSLRQAKEALGLALSRLKPGDLFNIIQFNSHTSQLFSRSQPASGPLLRQAQTYVHALRANGGTEMAPAILAALRNQMETSMIRQVIFLTDGSVGNEAQLFRIIQQNLADSRLFTIGIGSAPNSHFMNRAAEFGRGTHTYIGRIEEVQQQMAKLFRKLESPVLTDLQIHWPENEIVESWPQKIPDLYLGEPLLLSTKAKKLPGTIKVSGQVAGSAWNADLSLKGGQEKQGINVLWARKKIAALMNQRTMPTEAENIRNAILQTALQHHLVSKYTSLIAVDVTATRKMTTPLKKTTSPINLPAGWQYEKVFGHMPATATPAALNLLFGAGLVFLSLIIRFGTSLDKRI